MTPLEEEPLASGRRRRSEECILPRNLISSPAASPPLSRWLRAHATALEDMDAHGRVPGPNAVEVLEVCTGLEGWNLEGPWRN